MTLLSGGRNNNVKAIKREGYVPKAKAKCSARHTQIPLRDPCSIISRVIHLNAVTCFTWRPPKTHA